MTHWRHSISKGVRRSAGLYGLFALALAAAISPALAQEAAEPVTMETLSKQAADMQMVMNTVWTLIAAVLVFFMQAGFAMVESGMTRAKNACNIMMKNVMDFCMGSFGFWLVGFAFMFGAGNSFIGLSGFMLNPNEPFEALAWANVPLMCKFIFQLVFAATAATIVSGAMAERTKFSSYMVYSFAVTAFIYPIIGHWIWGGGWLQQLGMWDFAGSTVVHSTGGWLALAGAIVLGPRLGKFSKEGKPQAIPGHNIPMVALGVFILWFGWFGFNPGSTMTATIDIAHIAVTTNLAAAMGGIFAMMTVWALYGKPDTSMTLNGVLGGLVAVTAPCAFITPVSALIIGALGGIIVVFAVALFDRVRVDDPVGAISVHGVCGAFGTICVGLFAVKDLGGITDGGLFTGGGTKLLMAQLTGVGAVMAFALITGFTLFLAIKHTIGLRVSEREEIEGLDIEEHGAPAYGIDHLSPGSTTHGQPGPLGTPAVHHAQSSPVLGQP